MLALLLAIAGCVRLNPGADPFIVRSEQAIAAAVESVDGFLKLDDANRELSKHAAPEAHRIAESLRVNFPTARNAAVIAIRNYERSKTADGMAAVKAAVAGLVASSETARNASASIKKISP